MELICEIVIYIVMRVYILSWPRTKANSSSVGAAICESEKVTALSFTGSTGVGKLLLKQCAGTVKKCSMELGGQAPFIVFPSADLDKAVQALGRKEMLYFSVYILFQRTFIIKSGKSLHRAYGIKIPQYWSNLRLCEQYHGP